MLRRLAKIPSRLRARTLSSPASASPASKPPTAVVMLNMGGPAAPEDTGPFLGRLFGDGEIIQLGALQPWLGPLLARRRTPKVQKQYEQIGGSPIRKWTELQGRGMVEALDRLSPETAPHKAYVAFRYADPLTEEALREMKADGVTRAVAFSQYPQYSCTTTGSSLNHLWRELDRTGLQDSFKWSVLDRWPTHPTFVEAVVRRVEMGLDALPEVDDGRDGLDSTVVMFSAHSLPIKVVNRGDAYPAEVAATVDRVMARLQERTGRKYRHILAWQSQVGPLPWLGPQTGDVIKGLGAQGVRRVLAVPIAFTSDHIETLFEIDIEYAEDAAEAGIKHFARAPSLNDEPLLMQAQAELVAEHLASGEVASRQYALNCPHCVNPTCRSVRNPIGEHTTLRDVGKAARM